MNICQILYGIFYVLFGVWKNARVLVPEVCPDVAFRGEKNKNVFSCARDDGGVRNVAAGAETIGRASLCTVCVWFIRRARLLFCEICAILNDRMAPRACAEPDPASGEYGRKGDAPEMFNVGFPELILVLLIAFLVVGPKDLPKVARAIGRWVNYLRQLFSEFKEETGLDETLEEIKGTESDLKKTLQDIDPTREIRKAQQDAEQVIRDAKKEIKTKPRSNQP